MGDVKEIVRILRAFRQSPMFDTAANALEALSAEHKKIRDAAQFVHDTFAKDMAQGYRTKDKEFAVSILGKALTPISPQQSPPPPAPQIR